MKRRKLKVREKLKVKVIVDRPIGYKDTYGNVYPLNYGYIPGIIGGDNEEQDVYIIRESNEILSEFIGEVIAIAVRKDDVEEKWIVTDEKVRYSEVELYKRIEFMEKYFNTEIRMLD
ncbi:inorganic pyrophosphatase [Amphibacillus sp. Q70]|uniref:inorganic pyrophosphatase n=1 Tax=Amphibacillus sp. Q70 TaxID=3453416 RepID=UPI003F842A42